MITPIPRADRIVVSEGMTLYSIAKANQTSVEALKRLNGLTSDLIVVGSVIKTRETALVTPTAGGATVTVKAGDTLWRIATSNGLSVEKLKKLNNLSSDIIGVGQVLKVSRATSAPTVSVPSSEKTVTVKAGDTLWRIATSNGLSVEELKKLNNLSSDIIGVGQVLKVSRTTSVPTVSVPSSETTVTVKAGDTLWRIATTNGLSVEELKRLNNLNSDIIGIGQVLKVSRASSVSTVSVTSGEKTVTVKAGDTLWRIATSNGLSVEELKQLNNLSSDIIGVGQVLKVSRASSVPTVSVPSSETTVTVKAGDTLWAISQRHGTTVEALQKANQLTTNVLSIGQTLVIPTGVSVSQAKANDKDKAKEQVTATTHAQEKSCKVDPSDLGPHVIIGKLEELPEHVQRTFKGYESKNWRGTFKGQSTGTKAGGKYENENKYLPQVDKCGKEIEYKEFDINNKKDNEKRDAERFVRGVEDGSIYYTNSHYKEKFIKIK